MRTIFIILIFSCINLHAQEIVKITSYDGEIIEGRLNIPPTNFTNKIVIDIPSSGPHTYENMRRVGRSTEFKVHDYYSNEFSKRGIAYFSYSTRYTVPDSIPPYYDRVDKEKFFAYTPSIKLKDLEEVIKYLRNDERLASSQILLLGWSEGAILATLAAERQVVPIDAIFIAGTPHEDVFKTILWQLSGEAAMILFRKFFDINGDGIIQRSEYEEADPRAIARVGGQSFDELDVNRDSVLTAEDFKILAQPRLQEILTAIDNNDDEWIWNSFFRVGTKWIKEHRDLEPNSTRIMKLDLPVYIFHGTDDANTPVAGIMKMKDQAQLMGKNNLHFFIFPDHDHNLEFLSWVVRQSMPEGIEAMFDQVEQY